MLLLLCYKHVSIGFQPVAVYTKHIFLSSIAPLYAGCFFMCSEVSQISQVSRLSRSSRACALRWCRIPRPSPSAASGAPRRTKLCVLWYAHAQTIVAHERERVPSANLGPRAGQRAQCQNGPTNKPNIDCNTVTLPSENGSFEGLLGND